jgi:hypothetical protein
LYFFSYQHGETRIYSLSLTFSLSLALLLLPSALRDLRESGRVRKRKKRSCLPFTSSSFHSKGEGAGRGSRRIRTVALTMASPAAVAPAVAGGDGGGSGVVQSGSTERGLKGRRATLQGMLFFCSLFSPFLPWPQSSRLRPPPPPPCSSFLPPSSSSPISGQVLSRPRRH